jgi:alpha-tubulin suppressor-like RCC1 family protein
MGWGCRETRARRATAVRLARLFAGACPLLAVSLALAPAANAANAAVSWGSSEYGRLGVGRLRGTPPDWYREAFGPVLIASLGGTRQIAAGYDGMLALAEDGTAWAWGANGFAQLGLGTSTGPHRCGVPAEPCYLAPVPVPGLTHVRQLAEGLLHGLALREDGTVMAWGDNDEGQLGTGTITGPETCSLPEYGEFACSRLPVAVPGLSEVKAVAAGGRASYALRRDGTVMAWGDDSFGKLGIPASRSDCGERGISPCTPTPTRIPGLTGVTAIATGSSHTLALLEGGTVMSWGSNNTGELGDGTEDWRESPVAVQALSGVVAVSAGESHSVALLADGTVEDWGMNWFGQLGTGSNTGPELCSQHAPEIPCSTVPLVVPGLNHVTQVAAGGAQTLALRQDGTAMAWGYNENGELGFGSFGPESCLPELPAARCSKSPVAVEGLADATAVYAGAEDGFAIGPLAPAVTGVDSGGGARSGSEFGGGEVAITGSNLRGATSVHFGSHKAQAFTVVLASEIFAFAPPGTGTVPITVTTARGTSAPVSASDYEYVTPTGPAIGAVAPHSGAVSGGTVVTLEGVHLGEASGVWFGRNRGQVLEDGESRIVAVAPAGTVGRVNVSVRTPAGVSPETAGARYTYRPVVTGVAPAEGSPAGGTEVTIHGAGFTPGSATVIRFAGAPATAVDCADSTTCTALAPAHSAGTVDVVAMAAGILSARTVADRFSYR